MRIFGHIISILIWIFTIPVFSLSPSWEENPQILLWKIGEPDNHNGEFSLAPNHFNQYDRPGIHIVGATDPAKNWPYILPGKLDNWAGTYPQTFEIIFYLDKAVDRGQCKLTMDFMDTHSCYPPRMEVRLNNQAIEHQTQCGNNDWLMAAADNSGKEYVAAFQYPASVLNLGENRIEIRVLDGSWALWDAIRFDVPEGVEAGKPGDRTTIRSVVRKQVLVDRQGTLFKPLELEIMHTGDPVEAVIRTSVDEDTEVKLVKGIQKVEVWIPETEYEEEIDVEIYSGRVLLARTKKMIAPVRKWELHLIHQTHLDIGFTHTQEEVLEMQTGYLEQALDLIENTRDYPEEARFRWHPEGMWAIDEFLRQATPERKKEFIDAVQEQSIHLDAFYVHLLSGLASGEELFELMQPAKEFERKYGVPVRTAIGSDIPGYSWGLVTAMAAQGVKFFNMAPNNNHRLGFLYHWADKPFFWLGPDGQSRVFTWMASHSYIYFWDKDDGILRVPRFLDYLEESGFPYHIAMLRYEIGGDNGFPDPSLPDKVKAWNEKYAYPKIILSTNSRLYDSFTGSYNDKIPVVSGDLTPYWEDGAASTAADLALNRQAGERLLQARALHSLLDPGAENSGKVSEAWNNIIMYDEHTWGAYCSITEPFAPFTVSQEKYKQKFALEAERLSRELVKEAVQGINQIGSGIIDVYNTSSWIRSELVLLSPEQSEMGDRVLDDKGKPVVSQRLQSGELAFRAEDLPAFGARRYQIVKGSAAPGKGIAISKNEISNDLISLKIDNESGAIESIRMTSSGQELVDASQYGLNEYVYMLGRETGKNLQGIEPPVNVSIEDAGPLVGSLRVESGAPGCEKLTRLIRLTEGDPKIDLVNTVDKVKVLEAEGVYFTFPLHVPEGIARIDIPWGMVRPETDQLTGANRNYYSVQRWIDISNDRFGMTWVTLDAPMVAFTPVKIVGKGRGDSQSMAEFSKEGIRDWWNESINAGQTYHSWVMTNHWEVNYKAYQEGPVTFRYALIPHEGGYNGVKAEKSGREVCQPLLAVEVKGDSPTSLAPFSFLSDKVIATSLRSINDTDGLILRLYNPDSSRGNAQISGKDGTTIKVQYCDTSGIPTGPAGDVITLNGYGVATLRIDILSGQN